MRNVKAFIAGCAVAGAGLLGMAAAHAAPVGDTSDAFSGPAGDHSAAAMWTDIVPFFQGGGTSADAARLGQAVCQSLTEGSSEGEVIAATSEGHSQSVRAATYVVHAAEWHYCPEKY